MNDQPNGMSARARHEDRLRRFLEAEGAEFRAQNEQRRAIEQQLAAAERQQRLEEMRELAAVSGRLIDPTGIDRR
jgi:hypothetical protein